MTHAFISYSRKDTEFVEKLERALNARGIVTWRDVHSIPGGARWYRRIKAGLEASYVMIYVDTANAEASTWVEKEFLYADALKLPILPVKLDETFLSMRTIDLNPLLCDDAHFDAGQVKLAAALQSLPQQPIKPGATAPADEPPETPDEFGSLEADSQAVHDYLDWLLVQAKADLRDALYVDLAVSSERPRIHSALAVGLDDEEFTFTHVGLEHLVHEDFGKPGEDVPDARRVARQRGI